MVALRVSPEQILAPMLAGLAVVLTTIFVSACSPKVSDRTITPITVADTVRQLERSSESYALIDTRSASEFELGHLPGAVNITLPEADVRSIERQFHGTKGIIVYGDNPGSTAARAMAKRLIEGKIKNVRLLEEGFDGWVARGLPVDKQ